MFDSMQPHAKRKPLTVVDLFSGAGGLSEGFRQAGFLSLLGTDYDAAAGATYAWNHEKHGSKFVLGDIRDRSVQEAVLAVIAGREVDVVAGGPPCQAFSQVRNHKRIIDDPRNSLYRQFVAMVSEINPRSFVMENVPGLQNIGGGVVRDQILEDLEIGGRYDVKCQILDASDYGVPQVRERIIFIGVRRDLKQAPVFPKRTKASSTMKLARTLSGTYELVPPVGERASDLRRILSDLQDERLVTAEQALSDLEHIQPGSRLVRAPSNGVIEYQSGPRSAYQEARRRGSSSLFNADCPSIREDTVRRLDAVPSGGNFRDIPEDLRRRYLTDAKWGPDLGRDILSRKYFFAYRRLHRDYFSWTLNTKADCVFHYSSSRALTVREFARLHSFDDTYHFVAGDRHSRYRQVGNAVPPLLAKAIAEAVSATLQNAARPKAGKALAA